MSRLDPFEGEVERGSSFDPTLRLSPPPGLPGLPGLPVAAKKIVFAFCMGSRRRRTRSISWEGALRLSQ